MLYLVDFDDEGKPNIFNIFYREADHLYQKLDKKKGESHSVLCRYIYPVQIRLCERLLYEEERESGFCNLLTQFYYKNEDFQKLVKRLFLTIDDIKGVNEIRKFKNQIEEFLKVELADE